MRAVLLLMLAVASVIHTSAQAPSVRRSHLGRRAAPVAFTFVHITDTHIGEGAAEGDFGTPGFLDDTLTGNESGYTVDRLANVISHVNRQTSGDAPSFIIHSGDLTDSGERSEFMMARQLMDSSEIPYIPLMGNHDTWPYNRFGDEAVTACGDSLMNVVYRDVFDGLRGSFEWEDGTRSLRYSCPVTGNSAFLQNYAFVHSGVRFVFIDLNPRYHVRKDEPGIGPEAFISDGRGSTLGFLRDQLAHADERSQRVVIVAHHPPVSAVIGNRYSISGADKRTLARVIRPHRHRILGWFCGHLHRWARYRFSAAGIPVFETRAVKSARNGSLRIVIVHGD